MNNEKASVGEGGTPLIPSTQIAPRGLFFKLENCNPSGSYKDRFIAAEVGRLRSVGAGACVATSSGNTGSALAAVVAGRDDVTACFFGDGASNEGTFHESLNLAAVWKLPVIFVCENNQYGASTRVDLVMRNPKIADRASSYGFRGERVDGNDVLAVHDAVGPYLERAHRGEGPALLECLTYRMRGHYEGDAVKYREASELADWKAKDPVRRFATAARERGWLDDAAIEATEREARARVDEAARFTLASPWPEASALAEDVRG